MFASRATHTFMHQVVHLDQIEIIGLTGDEAASFVAYETLRVPPDAVNGLSSLPHILGREVTLALRVEF